MQSHNLKEIVEMNKKAFKEYLKLVTGCFYSTELYKSYRVQAQIGTGCTYTCTLSFTSTWLSELDLQLHSWQEITLEIHGMKDFEIQDLAVGAANTAFLTKPSTAAAQHTNTCKWLLCCSLQQLSRAMWGAQFHPHTSAGALLNHQVNWKHEEVGSFLNFCLMQSFFVCFQK